MNKFEVSFGSKRIFCIEFTTVSEINSMPTATLKISKKDFESTGLINYFDEVIIEMTEPRQQRLFVGNIASVKEDNDTTVVVNLEGGIEFGEKHMSGLMARNVSTPEAFYSIAKIAGIPNTRLSVEGLDVSDKEMVAYVPFKGMRVNEKTTIGDIELIDLTELKNKVVTDNNSLWKRFLDADGWLLFKFTSKHFSDAERLAIEKADAFFTLQSSAIQFSHSRFNNSIVNWERSRQSLHLKRTNLVLLVMINTGSVWLRDLTAYTPTKNQLSHDIEFSIDKVIKADEKQQLPLLLWNRFRDSDDYHVVTVGFWQIIELLCTDTKLPKKISKEDLQDFKERVSLSLAEDDFDKIKPIIENLNQRTLSEKFEKFLFDHDIELSEDDSQLIEAFRKIRNDIEHGRQPKEPPVQNLTRLKAVLNMLLINSYKRL